MKSGFTLIETLVAISVILLSLVGPLSIAAQALSAAYYARDQITAFYLAQEGVEYVRAVRDGNFLAGSHWLTGLSNCVSTLCTVDAVEYNNSVCPSGTCQPLNINNTTGRFTVESANATPSIYTRTVRIDPIAGNPDDVSLTVEVSWRSAGVDRTFRISEELLNWL